MASSFLTNRCCLMDSFYPITPVANTLVESTEAVNPVSRLLAE